MAVLWGWFAYRHLLAFHHTGEWAYVLVCGSETLTAAFFVFRSAPMTVSVDPLDWLFGIAGTFTTLLFFPAPWGLLPIAKNLIVFGTVLQIFGLISLNRSFALVAAQRELKTRGMYRFVRHPLYAELSVDIHWVHPGKYNALEFCYLRHDDGVSVCPDGPGRKISRPRPGVWQVHAASALPRHSIRILIIDND